MKKTLAVLIAAVLVATALCACLTVSAETTNLALGATITGAEPTNGNPWTDRYNASLVDGVAEETVALSDAPQDWFAYYYHADYVSNAPYDSEASQAVGTFTVDLGAVASVETVRLHMVTDEATTNGAVAPQRIKVEYSADNAAWETLVEETDFSAYSGVAWVVLEGDAAVEAQYVRVSIGFRGYTLLINEVEILGNAISDENPSTESGEDPEETSGEASEETSEPETSTSDEATEPETSDETTEPEASEPETPDETTEPEASDETSDEASEPETSEPETSEPETSEPDEPSVPTETKNVAEGKPYTGAEPSTNPNNTRYNANLTDGVAKDSLTDLAEGDWFAFYFNQNDGVPVEGVNAPDQVGTFVIDLEAVYSVSAVKINTFVGNMWGIVPPESIKVEYSEDGETFALFAEKSFTTPELEKDETGKNIEVDIVEFVEFKGAEAVNARYIKVTVKLGGIFAFINEVQVMGEVPVAGGETSDPETSEPETSDPTTSEPETSEPATSEPATSEPATSEPATSTPATSEPTASSPAPSAGDLGVIGFVVLAVVAIAGAAVAVKVRH